METQVEAPQTTLMEVREFSVVKLTQGPYRGFLALLFTIYWGSGTCDIMIKDKREFLVRNIKNQPIELIKRPYDLAREFMENYKED